MDSEGNMTFIIETILKMINNEVGGIYHIYIII